MKARGYRSYRVRDKVFVALILLFFSLTSLANEPDWRDYNSILKKYVSTATVDGVRLNVVNYDALRKDPLYRRVLTQVQRFDISQLKTKEEKLAYYINTYNLFALKMITDHWPIKSIKDAGSLFSSVWKKEIAQINNRNVSLHHIEHEVLRKMGEPRIHMAIVCASVSCPDLRNEAYTATRLNQQLDEQSHIFLMNTGKGLRIKRDEVEVSKLFKWFEDDFSSYGGVQAFMKKYRTDLPSKFTIDDYLPYNWQLNNKP